jgi:hypothetical protein
MMTTIWNNVHPALAVSCLAHVLDGLRTARRVHPVVVTIYKGDGYLELVDSVYEREAGKCSWS